MTCVGRAMKITISILLAAATLMIVAANPAHAQATRTWVSGVGDDINPCSRTAPCKTFAGAISKTTTGGIINCLDPGGFGAVTITKDITIDCEETLGGVLVSGTNAIVVSTTGVVNLRGLDIEGEGTGLIGINITQAATVYVRKSKIYGFQAGSATGIAAPGGGTLIVEDSIIQTNGTGINVSGGNTHTSLRNVSINNNAVNGISFTTSGKAVVDRTTIGFNGATGLVVNSAGLTVMLGNSTIVGNTLGTSAPAGTLWSFKNNQVGGNVTDGTPITPFPGPGGPLQ